MSRFRVLGPLKAEPGTPSAAKPRVVLGLLLVAANNEVSVDCLIDELWGDNPPRTARSTLYVYISKLRKILSADGSDGVGLIESSLPGYLIKVAPGELDMHDFEELVRRGRGHYQQRDFAAAARELRAALDLWTGPALSGLPRGPRLEDAASHLELTRTEALEQRISADLWAGRDSRLIGELADLARAHPLRETLHAHLIVALYRADRRAEALHAYDTLRRSLAGELGLDPGPGLRALHQRVLRTEPVRHFDEFLDGAGPAALSGQAAPVVRFPGRSPVFVGRADDLAAGQEILRGSTAGHPVLDIVGAPGIGKTSFGVELAYRTADLFPDGRVFVPLRGADSRPLDSRGVLLRMTRLLRRGPGALPPDTGADADELADVLRIALSGRRILIMLDDVACAEQVRPVLSQVSAGAVMLTSRRPSGVPGARHLALEAFDGVESSALLVATAGPRSADDSGSVASIAGACGGSPLALRAAGAVLAARPHWSARRLAESLADTGKRLDVLAVGDPEIRGRLLGVYHDADPVLQRAFRLLCVIPGRDFPTWPAATVLRVSHYDAECVLEDLVQSRLLRVSAGDGQQVRYGYDELSRALALELQSAGEDTEQVRAAVLRLCRCYGVMARHAQESLAREKGLPSQATGDGAPEFHLAVSGTDFLPVGAARRWLEAEHAALVVSLLRAHSSQVWPVIRDLAAGLAAYYEVSGQWEHCAALARVLLDAAHRVAERN